MKKKILIGSMSIFVFVGLVLFFLLNEIFEEEVIDSKEKYIAAKSGLNLRANPDKSSKAVTLIPFGAKVTIEKSEGEEIFLDDRYGKWVNVKYGNKAGWLFSGYLCDFKPDEIIKVAADYYRKKYKTTGRADNESFTNFKDSQLSIKDIIDNYIVLSLKIPGYSLWGDFVWRYDRKRKFFFEVYSEDDDKRVNFLYLDNDKYLDLIINKARSTEALGIEILLGSENGLIKIYDSFDDGCCDMHDGYSMTIGRCGDMTFSYGRGGDTMYFFRFNCDTRKLEQYAKNKITYTEGVILSVDFKNKSFVIKDKKDLKNKTYKINLTDEDIEYWKENFKKGNNVSFYYITIDGEKMFMGWQSE